jgi:ubiquitin-protein ligase
LTLLQARLKNEIEICRRKLKHTISVEDAKLDNFPVQIRVTLSGVPGPIWEGDALRNTYAHEFVIYVYRNYPFMRPLVNWKTPIFHPNICPPSEAFHGNYGHVCTALLDRWSASSNLHSFIKAVESLLLNPNPKSPLPTATCKKAARYFSRHPYKPPTLLPSERSLPRVVAPAAEDAQEKQNGENS